MVPVGLSTIFGKREGFTIICNDVVIPFHYTSIYQFLDEGRYSYIQIFKNTNGFVSIIKSVDVEEGNRMAVESSSPPKQ